MSYDKSVVDALAKSYAGKSFEELDLILRGDNDVKGIAASQVLSERAKSVVVDTRGAVTEDSAAKKAWQDYIRRGVPIPSAFEQRAPLYNGGQNEGGFGAGASYTAGQNGGYMVPQGFWDQLTIALKSYSGYGEWATQVNTPTGNPMNWPTIDPTGYEGAVITEATGDQFGAPVLNGAANTAETPFAFGQGTLQAWLYTSGIQLLSIELVQDSAIDVDALIKDRIAEVIGRAIARDEATGSGSGHSLGLETALIAKGAVTSSGGTIAHSTTAKVNTVGQSAPPSAANESAAGLVSDQTLLAMLNGVDYAYHGNSAWYGTFAQLNTMRSVADSYGRPLYPELNAATPMLRGYEFRIVQSSNGLVFGDLSRALVRRTVNGAEVMRLVERYADARQVGYSGFLRRDQRSNDLRAATLLV